MAFAPMLTGGVPSMGKGRGGGSPPGLPAGLPRPGLMPGGPQAYIPGVAPLSQSGAQAQNAAMGGVPHMTRLPVPPGAGDGLGQPSAGQVAAALRGTQRSPMPAGGPMPTAGGNFL